MVAYKKTKVSEQDILSRYAAGEREFRHSRIPVADFRGAKLHGIDLSYTDMRPRAKLRGADLSDARLVEVLLTDADLSNANLRETRITTAWLNNVDFRGADLRGADLEGSDISGADFRGADLRGARLWRNYARGATYDQFTRLPEKFDAVKSGMQYVETPVEILVSRAVDTEYTLAAEAMRAAYIAAGCPAVCKFDCSRDEQDQWARLFRPWLVMRGVRAITSHISEADARESAAVELANDPDQELTIVRRPDFAPPAARLPELISDAPCGAVTYARSRSA